MEFGDAVRAIFFDTGLPDFLYATHGGTAFVVRFRGKLYGLTCGHVFKDFPPAGLFLTQDKHGAEGTIRAPIARLAYPSSPRGHAQDTDVEDICVIEFDESIPSDFFRGAEYSLDDSSTGRGVTGHDLLICGVLKEKTVIDPPTIEAGYCRLQMRDFGPSSDPTLRRAEAVFDRPEFSTVVGVSGAPVYDVTAEKLCGMVVRGGMSGDRCSLLYIEMFDILQLVEAVAVGAKSADYMKDFWIPRPPEKA